MSHDTQSGHALGAQHFIFPPSQATTHPPLPIIGPSSTSSAAVVSDSCRVRQASSRAASAPADDAFEDGVDTVLRSELFCFAITKSDDDLSWNELPAGGCSVGLTTSEVPVVSSDSLDTCRHEGYA
jgi:hypothetical protein